MWNYRFRKCSTGLARAYSGINDCIIGAYGKQHSLSKGPQPSGHSFIGSDLSDNFFCDLDCKGWALCSDSALLYYYCYDNVHSKPGGDAIPAKREIAAFEAGIKLGALYHQFVGTPVSVETASSLEQAISRSISLQPYVKSVKVSINRDMLKKNLFGYGELEGRMIDAEVEIDYQGEIVRARLKYDQEKNYPLMRLL